MPLDKGRGFPIEEVAGISSHVPVNQVEGRVTSVERLRQLVGRGGTHRGRNTHSVEFFIRRGDVLSRV